MLIGKNIHKSFNGLEVLKGVDLNIEKSSITSIIGKSGTGKTTLLHILGTLDTADVGEIIIGGQNISSIKPALLPKFRNEKIGFVFQFHHLISEFTALENVCIPALIKNVSKKDAQKEAEKLLDFLGLSERTHHKPNELSGGEQQRVAVARALINKPLIVFADEPTGNLDNQTSTDLHNLFVNLKNELGQTFIIVTHNQELASLSDKILEMKDGTVHSKI